MTVEEILEVYKGKEIKIGANTGFFYCGVVDDKTKGVLERKGEQALKESKKRLKMAQKHLENLDDIWKEKTIQQIALHKDTDKQALLEKLGRKKEQDKTRTIKAIHKKEEHIKTFTPFLTREIKEIYKSTVNQNIKIIIFEGVETSIYWDREEYERGAKSE